MSVKLRMKNLSGESTRSLSYLLKVVIRIYSFKMHFFYSLLRVTHHTVLRNSAFEKGKDRALDLLPQKTVARLEVLTAIWLPTKKNLTIFLFIVTSANVAHEKILKF